MKILSVIVLLAVSAQAQATTYKCLMMSAQNEVILSVSPSQVFWDEQYDSASSKAISLGMEDAPYSEYCGYQIFQLVDFYKTEDSSFKLGLSPEIMNNQPTGMAVLYFDNDGHDENINKVTCEKI